MRFLKIWLIIYLAGSFIFQAISLSSALYYYVISTKNFPNWSFFNKAVRIILATIIYLIAIGIVILLLVASFHLSPN